jgi:hypothetical protein
MSRANTGTMLWNKSFLEDIHLIASPPRFYGFARPISKIRIGVCNGIQEINHFSWFFRRKVWESTTFMA